MVGVVAQLVERLVRNQQVRGSNPLGSTILRSELTLEGSERRNGVLRSLGEGGLLP